MIRNAVVALAAPFMLSNAQPAEEYYTNIPEVHQVLCNGGTLRGTAWRNGIGSMVTARHVTHGNDCVIDGEPVTVTWESAELDMAVIRTARWGVPLKINCDGYKDGEAYAGIGYARGEPRQQVVFVMFDRAIDAALPRWLSFRTLVGDRFIPGQSGGISINGAMEVVGLVNGFNSEAPLSYSQELKGTPLCP